MVSSATPFDPTDLTVRELLATSVGVLDELLRRSVIRTRNSPLGDLAESVALRAYGGSLAPNSEKSYDLETDDRRRLQVKARSLRAGDSRSQGFSAFRSWDFDSAVFLVFDAATFDLLWARELTRTEAETLGRRVEHTNSFTITVRQVSSAGVDVTNLMTAAYEGIDKPAGQA